MISNAEMQRAMGASIWKKSNVMASTYMMDDLIHSDDMNTMMDYTCEVLLDDNFVDKSQSFSRSFNLIINSLSVIIYFY